MGHMDALGEYMLIELSIKNLALIDEARISFGVGLNVLTGETGAGKTVVVGAINLLLGGRADSSLIRTGSNRAEVQGLFSIPPTFIGADEKLSDLVEDEDHIIIRRIVSVDGKNKCYINDRLVTVATLSDIGKRLIDLHGQHEHQSLFKTASHIDYLDKYGGESVLSLHSRYEAKYNQLIEARKELTQLRNNERDLLSKRDLLHFQVTEIDKADLTEGEDEELIKEREIQRNAEKLLTAISKAGNAIAGSSDTISASELLALAVGEMRMAAGIDRTLDGLADRLNSVLIEIEDCLASLRDYESRFDYSPGRLQEIEDRLVLISLLKKKYGESITDIVSYRKQAFDELQACDTSGERIERLESDVERIEKELALLALNLSDARKATAENFAREVMAELAGLNMKNAIFEVSLDREIDQAGLPIGEERIKFYPTGIDKVEFLVSANKGEPVAPLAKVASGGEISRIMLSLKIALADADEIPTLVFDEIDVGIGGTTAIAIGQKLLVLSGKHQILSVTHLPQIASFADRHFTVYKRDEVDRAFTKIEELSSNGRISEMARLLSGDSRSDVSLKHAEELLFQAQNSKVSLVGEKS